MPVRTTKNASVCERSLPVSTDVRTTYRATYLFSKDILSERGIPLDLEKKGTEFEINLDAYPKFKTSKFGPYSKNHKRTSIRSNHEIPIYESRSKVDQVLWRSMIGSLMSPTTDCSDVYNKMEVCVRYQASLKFIYLLTTKVEYIATVRRCRYPV